MLLETNHAVNRNNIGFQRSLLLLCVCKKNYNILTQLTAVHFQEAYAMILNEYYKSENRWNYGIQKIRATLAGRPDLRL